MSREKHPIFLERGTYRKRRMADASRILPLVGVVLLALPMLWTSGGDEGALTTHVMGYIFGVWVLLAILGAGLSLYLGRESDEADTDKDI